MKIFLLILCTFIFLMKIKGIKSIFTRSEVLRERLKERVEKEINGSKDKDLLMAIVMVVAFMFLIFTCIYYLTSALFLGNFFTTCLSALFIIANFKEHLVITEILQGKYEKIKNNWILGLSTWAYLLYVIYSLYVRW